MTRATNTQYNETHATEAVEEFDVLVDRYPVPLRRGEVGKDMSQAVKTGARWTARQATKRRRTLSNATRPATA